MAELKQSPLPWHVGDYGHVFDTDGHSVASCSQTNYANSHLIVAAVNSHAELLAAIKGLLRFNEELCADINVSKHYPSAEKALAAIAHAEELAP